MKKRLISGLTLLLLILSTTIANAAKFNIERDVVATNGCHFHISGWINVTWSGSVNHYSLKVTGPCGNYEFNGIGINPGTGTPTGEDEQVTAYKITVIDTETQKETTDYPFTSQEVMEACQVEVNQ